MDLFKILSDIEKVDPEVYERFDTRRRAFKYISGMGKAVTAATLPGLLSTMFNKAYGQTATLPAEIVTTLNLALQLEYLERYFYQRGLDTPGLIPSADVPAITIIRDDELGHIAAIRAVLGSQAFGPDPGATAFDYTANARPGVRRYRSTRLQRRRREPDGQQRHSNRCSKHPLGRSTSLLTHSLAAPRWRVSIR
jgi:hypothetical protein